MSEKEILEIIKIMMSDNFCLDSLKAKKALNGLLYLYQKEKEKNLITATDIENYKRISYNLGRSDSDKQCLSVIQRHYISKDKIKAKIEELNKKTANVVTDEINQITIKILQELLEEEK